MISVPGKKSYKVPVIIFVLAFLFWFMVKMSKDYDYTLEIPLEVINNNEEICLKYPAPQKVRVEFTGRGIELLQLNFYDPYYYVDLSAEKHSFELNLTEHPEYVRISDKLSVRVKSILSPHEIKFELDKQTEKKIPVNVRADIKTENGFIWVGMVAIPDSVLVTGPVSYVDTLKSLPTVKKNYTDIALAFKDESELITNPRFYGEYDPEKVEVSYDVQRLAEREIANVPVNVINVPDNREVVPLPSTVKVYVKGGEKILAEATSKDFEVIVDFERDWQPDATGVKASLRTDLNVSYLESRPPYFELIVQKKRGRTE
jgi:YbbR domain-containing protein